jgi:hypothetical protein
MVAKDRDVMAADSGVGHSNMQDDEKWKKLWKLDVLPRVQVFWWRVLRGILPDYAILTRRHVRVNSICSVCKSASESLYHALIECRHAKQFWVVASDLLHLKIPRPRLKPHTWASDLLCDPMFDQGERVRYITVMAAIWDSRNRWTHEEAGYDPVKTMETVGETIGYLENKKEGKTKAKSTPCIWQKPGPGVIKINTDGAVRLDQGVAGGGGVAGDSQGFRGAWCRLYQGISDPLCIEALAVRDAVVFASQQGFCRLVIETDCQELVKLWKERQVGLLLLLLLVRLKIFYFF